ncbi:MAG: hypothetical protein IK990_00470 [Ruminiclostridium sp.]|nr:hypothetical protein [Ruminiclostridium sp.]
MAGKALKASGKRVVKYSRDGAVERDLAESSETRISGRTEDAVLQKERTDERLNARESTTGQPEPEHKHRRHTPSDVQEQPQNTENGQSNSDLKFEDKTFKFDDTDIPAPAVNETVPVEAPAAAETPAVPDNSEQQPETPQSTVAAQVIPNHSDDTDEIPQDSFIIENLFAEFYGSDEAPASGSKSDKFSFRQDEQPAPNTGKKRKAGRLQEDMHGDSKLKAETASTSLKQDAAKSGLMFGSAVKSAESIEGETAEMTDGESGSKLSHKRRQRRGEPDEDEALAEESENADTLKFEHSNRSLEKQSHYADKLSTGSSASKKLSESKLPREEISEEEQARQDVRKRQRKAQQAEQAKKKAETTVDDKVSETFDKTEQVLPLTDIQPLTEEERTRAVRAAVRKATRAEKNVEKAEWKLEKAESKLPSEAVFHRERKADRKSGKIKSKLRLEKEVKPENRPDSFLQAGAKGVATTITGAVKSRVHGKISEYEQDNAALKAAHKTEQVGESALRFTKDTVARINDREKKAIYRKTERLRFERDSAVKKANTRSSQLQFEEAKAKKKARDAARKAQRKQQRKKAQKAAKTTKSVIQKTAEFTEKVVSGMVHALTSPVFLIVMLIIALVLVLVFCLVSLFGSIGAESGAKVILSSYTSEDEQMYQSEEYMAGLEESLREKINSIPELYPGYNEYRYNIGPIGHDPYGLISYLTAKYQTFQSENVSGDISELFSRLYDLSFKEITEQRQKTVTYTDGGLTKTKTVAYTVKILETTLNTADFDAAVRSLLTDEQYAQYELLKQTQGNRSDLF